MSWVTPTGHDDPDNAWDAETNVYDDNENTSAGASPASGVYSKFLHVTHIAMNSDRLRFMAYGDGTVDIDVKLGGVWTHVFEGVTVHHTWMEKTFLEGSVDEIRFRLKRVGPTVAMYEVDFYRLALLGGSSPNISLISLALGASLAIQKKKKRMKKSVLAKKIGRAAMKPMVKYLKKVDEAIKKAV